MASIVLINPNTSSRSLRMMIEAACPHLPPGVAIHGVSAAAGAPMIVSEADLRAAALEVVRLGVAASVNADAIIVAAFGDPGVAVLRGLVDIPVIGIGEASLEEAARGGRRFGIATTTPALVGAIEAMVETMRSRGGFTGVRVPDGDPVALAADPRLQETVLARLAADCLHLDAADVVVIGGGPLSGAARALRERYGQRIIEPVPPAIRRALRLIELPPPA